jgi:hypothetical protein
MSEVMQEHLPNLISQRVYDHRGVSYLSHARGSYISCSDGRGEVCHDVHGVIRVRIWRAIASIYMLLAMVL